MFECTLRSAKFFIKLLESMKDLSTTLDINCSETGWRCTCLNEGRSILSDLHFSPSFFEYYNSPVGKPCNLVFNIQSTLRQLKAYYFNSPGTTTKLYIRYHHNLGGGNNGSGNFNAANSYIAGGIGKVHKKKKKEKKEKEKEGKDDKKDGKKDDKDDDKIEEVIGHGYTGAAGGGGGSSRLSSRVQMRMDLGIESHRCSEFEITMAYDVPKQPVIPIIYKQKRIQFPVHDLRKILTDLLDSGIDDTLKIKLEGGSPGLIGCVGSGTTLKFEGYSQSDVSGMISVGHDDSSKKSQDHILIDHIFDEAFQDADTVLRSTTTTLLCGLKLASQIAKAGGSLGLYWELILADGKPLIFRLPLYSKFCNEGEVGENLGSTGGGVNGIQNQIQQQQVTYNSLNNSDLHRNGTGFRFFTNGFRKNQRPNNNFNHMESYYEARAQHQLTLLAAGNNGAIPGIGANQISAAALVSSSSAADGNGSKPDSAAASAAAGHGLGGSAKPGSEAFAIAGSAFGDATVSASKALFGGEKVDVTKNNESSELLGKLLEKKKDVNNNTGSGAAATGGNTTTNSRVSLTKDQLLSQIINRPIIDRSIEKAIDPEQDLQFDQPIEFHPEFGVRDAMLTFYLPQKQFKVQPGQKVANSSGKNEDGTTTDKKQHAGKSGLGGVGGATASFQTLDTTPIAQKRREIQGQIAGNLGGEEGPDPKKLKM